jgi:beta-lactamase class D
MTCRPKRRKLWLRVVAITIGTTVLSSCSTAYTGRLIGTSVGEPLGCAALKDARRSAFALYEVKTDRLTVCNPSRAAQRFVPASTFKIPHTLLALQSGVVVDERRPFIWDGGERGVGIWNKDTSLAEAIPASTVWVFQQIAVRLGPAEEAAALRRFGYGNQSAGTSADLRHFWLSGPLQISAIEQVDFLNRFRANELDVDRSVQERTKTLLKVGNCGSDCIIYGKTGAVLPINDSGYLRNGDNSVLPKDIERTGWFVGWMDRPDADGGPVVFAHNLDLALPGAMAARTSVAFEILSANGVDRVVPRQYDRRLISVSDGP